MAIETPRMTALKKLSAQIPVANSRIAQQQQASRDIQLQQAVKAAPASMGVPQAQQLAQTQATNAGQQALQTQKQGMQTQAQVADLAAQEQKQATQSRQFGLEQGVEQQRLSNVEKLASLSEKAKQEMFDSRLQFQKDEMGRTFLNERQLADYAKLTAKNDAEYKAYAQQAEQQQRLKIQTLETINRRLENAMKNQFAKEQEGLSRMNEQDIQKMKQDVENRLAKAKADAANTTAKWGAAGTIVGAVVGYRFGGASGATAGGSLGGAAGGAAGGTSASRQQEEGYAEATQTAGGG